MAAPLVFLLLLPMVPAHVVKEIRSRINNKSTKDYMEQRVGLPDVGQRGKEGQQTGSGAADIYGTFIVDLSLGTSPQTLPLVMDITSDLVWVQCKPCPSCKTLTPPTTPVFLADSSKSFGDVGCANQTCRIMRDTDCPRTDDLCMYKTSYMSGLLATETFSFGTTQVPGMAFGCTWSVTSDITVRNLDGASGFAGFSRGPLSLVSQLNISSFTYFIAPHDVAPPGKSFVGWSWGGANIDGDGVGVQTTITRNSSTPLLAATKNQAPYLYYVNLTGMQVDGELLTAIPAGSFDSHGGVSLSTTLPYTYLPEAAYRVLRRELVSRIQAEGVAPMNASVEGGAGDLDRLCFLTHQFANVRVPILALMFDGAHTAMGLKVENYFFAQNAGRTCLTILPSADGPVLGNLLQAGRKMTYEIHGDGGGVLTFETFDTAEGAPAPTKVPLMIMATLLLAMLL
ncbi:aspartic proteinase nepenthesin-1-like [Triticum dicoccoides]|uniref:aspartic proteinase nepenthesin-1-like n=1 Tax=Triticum dicoccoides TaxID=85692 RepID=UPI00188EE7ED|nr:aspartic proteinase nepenthesin-1-like [Triticum dicoccoides]